jgi:hypothetical protein
MFIKFSLLAIFILFTLSIHAQTNFTKQLAENHWPPAASIEQVSWIQGHWQGEAFGGITEEIWSPPMAGTMMFSFRLVSDNQVVFYEFGTISEQDSTLLLQIKHFHPNLHGWEDKDKSVDFRLIEIQAERVYFEGFTFEKIGPDEINIYVLMGEGEKTNEVKFNYHRTKKTPVNN